MESTTIKKCKVLSKQNWVAAIEKLKQQRRILLNGQILKTYFLNRVTQNHSRKHGFYLHANRGLKKLYIKMRLN